MYDVELKWSTRFDTKEELDAFVALIAEVHLRMYASETAYDEITKELSYYGARNLINFDVEKVPEPTSKFKVNDHVKILPYKDDEINRVGRINKVDEDAKLYYVTNMNMPYAGTVSCWFGEDELEHV